MPLTDKATIIQKLSPPLDLSLATDLLDEFISLEKRYVLRDWEPAELDAGQFSEILARILYHVDSGNLNRGKEIDDCLKYILNESVTHSITPRHDAIHMEKVIRITYKFRSQRGAVHISPNYKANHMDSRFMMECVRWLMTEMMRMFFSGDREIVSKTIRELLQFDVPCIGKFENSLMVQRVDLSPEEELLVLLHFAGEHGFSRKELGVYAKLQPSSVTRALQSLTSANCRQVIEINDRYRLTDLGSKRIRDQMPEKLLLQ